MKRLIVTADDFGLCPEVNEAVARAHDEGVLTCASLMVAGGAVVEAVAMAKARLTLGVGLHLVLVDGAALLPRERIPGLVDERGRFSRRLAWSGTRYFFSRALRRQVEAECRAQIEAFRGTGLSIDHLTGHNHFHLHPTVLDIVVGLAREYGIPAVRLPDPHWEGLPLAQLGMAAAMAPWIARTRRVLAGARLAFNHRVVGLFETGAMVERAWLNAIERLVDGVTELYCHPAVRSSPLLEREMPGYRHAEEFSALISPTVRQALDCAGVDRIRFAALR